MGTEYIVRTDSWSWAVSLSMEADAAPPSGDVLWVQYPKVLFDSGEPWHVVEIDDRTEEQAFTLPVTQAAIEAGRELVE